MGSSCARRLRAVFVISGLAVWGAADAEPAESPNAMKLRAVRGATVRAQATDGDAQVKALLDLVKQENAAALAAREPRRAMLAAPPTSSSKAGHTTFSNRAAMPAPGVEGIHTVNKKATGYIATPGGYLTIQGYGFGDLM